jgi:hypothetical protein
LLQAIARDALGMSTAQLARRLEVSQPRIVELGANGSTWQRSWRLQGHRSRVGFGRFPLANAKTIALIKNK